MRLDAFCALFFLLIFRHFKPRTINSTVLIESHRSCLTYHIRWNFRMNETNRTWTRTMRNWTSVEIAARTCVQRREKKCLLVIRAIIIYTYIFLLSPNAVFIFQTYIISLEQLSVMKTMPTNSTLTSSYIDSCGSYGFSSFSVFHLREAGKQNPSREFQIRNKKGQVFTLYWFWNF